MTCEGVSTERYSATSSSRSSSAGRVASPQAIRSALLHGSLDAAMKDGRGSPAIAR